MFQYIQIIHFDGICSPETYKGLGVGDALINALIKIGKFNGIKYIDLDCKGSLMNYYKKFGFKVIEQKFVYDSDDESDDEDDQPIYRRKAAYY